MLREGGVARWSTPACELRDAFCVVVLSVSFSEEFSVFGRSCDEFLSVSDGLALVMLRKQSHDASVVQPVKNKSKARLSSATNWESHPWCCLTDSLAGGKGCSIRLS